ncbi:MAG: hypothetical protein ACNA7K_05060 [Acholeplasmataceae bacterium]
MLIKKYILRLSLFSLMVFSPFISMNHSYAYWFNEVAPNSDTTTGSVTIGEWNIIQEWDPNAVYDVGAIVIYNGIEYTSLRAGNNKVPGANGSGNWWAAS